MRRLLLFLVTTVLLLGGNALLNWWVDPFGDFWKPAAVDEAAASRPPCLVSHEVIGGQYLPFKLDVFRRRPTHVFVTGSSRVLKIAARPGEETFANLGMPVITPEIVRRELELLPGDAPPQTVYLGVEAFWFNPAFRGFDVEPSFQTKTRYLLSRSAFESSLRILRAAPYVLPHRWRKERVGKACVVGRERPALAWKLDGSRVWSFELQPGTYHPVAEPFTTDLHVLRTGNYADWRSFSERRVRILAKTLAYARARGWRVVGFTPPDGARYLRFFASQPQVGPRWREFARRMPRLFHRFGFPWLDLRDARTIPCRESDFVDGGYHTNAACSGRMRDRLDTAAGLLAKPRRSRGTPLTLVALGDSIPAAVPRECGNCTGYVALYARALAEAAGREVRVENLAIPGSDSGDLRASVYADPALGRIVARADAVIVTIGHNDRAGAGVLGPSLSSILDTIRDLRMGRPTLLRVTNFYDDRPGDEALSRTICGVARNSGVPCADVYHALNRSLLADGVHPNPRGHRVIARLLVRLGFAPLASRP